MRIEDREEFVDLVAQAVIDRIEERDRIAGLVDLVVRRVVELQQQAALSAVPHDQHSEDTSEDTMEEDQNAGE